MARATSFLEHESHTWKACPARAPRPPDATSGGSSVRPHRGLAGAAGWRACGISPHVRLLSGPGVPEGRPWSASSQLYAVLCLQREMSAHWWLKQRTSEPGAGGAGPREALMPNPSPACPGVPWRPATSHGHCLGAAWPVSASAWPPVHLCPAQRAASAPETPVLSSGPPRRPGRAPPHILHLITSAETLFLNPVTFVGTGH